MRRVLATAILAIGIGTGGAVLATAGVASAHEPGTNGCTLSPDVGYVPVYYNFHRSCDRHDLCYLNKPYGDTSAGRKACDDAFRADMKAWCNGYYDAWWQSPARVACRGVADIYYTAVRTFGGPFF
jgi:Prokaryotic phospholipase A2